MSITVATKKLIEVLSDAFHTAGDRGVHIATYRAPWKDEPGDVDLLAVTSTTGFVMGHTWIRCDGQLRAPAVWPLSSTASLMAICKSLAKKGDENNEHTVDLDMVTADYGENNAEDEHPGWTVTLTETPALFDSDTEFTFHAHPEIKFPINGVRRILSASPRPDGEKAPEPSLLTMWSASILAPLTKVASRRGEPLQFFRAEDRPTQRVQIGDTWIGAASPRLPEPGVQISEPTIEGVLGAPEIVTGAAADLLRNGSGVYMGHERAVPADDDPTLDDAAAEAAADAEADQQ